MKIDIQAIENFLYCPTPLSWCEQAVTQLETLLLDHAHCEKKAASTAITLLFRYPEHEDLIYQLSRIAREELRHFEQVLKILKKRNIPFKHLQPSRYAGGLKALLSTYEPNRLIDILIMNAFVEARSCERFARLLPYLEGEIKDFYESLLASEARHFETYINFAKTYADYDLTKRIAEFAEKEAELINAPDTALRFHSGPLVRDSCHSCQS